MTELHSAHTVKAAVTTMRWIYSNLSSSHKHNSNFMCVVRWHLVQDLHSTVNHLQEAENNMNENMNEKNH